MGRLLEDHDAVQRNFRFRPDEIFSRVKVSLLVALIAEQALAEQEKSEIPSERSYLLLDVRDSDEYNTSHILTAENYPKTMLSRAHFESPSLQKYVEIFLVERYFSVIKKLPFQRNHPEHVIIMYDSDESQASPAATVLVQRGYKNIYMLSGGLKVLQNRERPHTKAYFLQNNFMNHNFHGVGCHENKYSVCSQVARQCFPHSLVVAGDSATAVSADTAKILTTQLQQMAFRYRK